MSHRRLQPPFMEGWVMNRVQMKDAPIVVALRATTIPAKIRPAITAQTAQAIFNVRILVAHRIKKLKQILNEK
jgi:hypothetical protein